MNITQDIIEDLLPAYFSGEASVDTHRLVEDFFRKNPAFEVQARRSAQIVEALGRAPLARPDAAGELVALKRARRVLRVQRILMAVALTFSFNAVSLGFSFEVSDGRLHPLWLALPWQGPAVVILGLVAAALWFAYARAAQMVRRFFPVRSDL